MTDTLWIAGKKAQPETMDLLDQPMLQIEMDLDRDRAEKRMQPGARGAGGRSCKPESPARGR